jgi:hypothetical protein
MPSQNPKDYTYGPSLNEWLESRRQEQRASEKLMDGMAQMLRAKARRDAAKMVY